MHDKNYREYNINYSSDLHKILTDVDVVIAPMRGADENGILYSTFVNKNVILDKKFFDYFNKNMLFIMGIIRNDIKFILEDKDIKYIELTALDELAILNSIPTAEGVLQAAFKKSDLTIYGNKTLITGLGRVGLSVSWRLKALGAEVFFATRSNKAAARGRDMGLKRISYNQLEKMINKFKFIINTVPSLLFTKKLLKKVDENAVILDLASSPGGVDFECAKELGVNAFLLPGLPGKIAPLTAAEFLADIIGEKLNEFRRGEKS